MVVLSVLAILSTVSVRTGGQIALKLQSKAARRMRNFASQVSDWEAAMVREGLSFVGVMSLVTESDVRTDWLSGIETTTMDDAVGLFIFWDCRAMRAVVIVLMTCCLGWWPELPSVGLV